MDATKATHTSYNLCVCTYPIVQPTKQAVLARVHGRHKGYTYILLFCLSTHTSYFFVFPYHAAKQAALARVHGRHEQRRQEAQQQSSSGQNQPQQAGQNGGESTVEEPKAFSFPQSMLK